MIVPDLTAHFVAPHNTVLCPLLAVHDAIGPIRSQGAIGRKLARDRTFANARPFTNAGPFAGCRQGTGPGARISQKLSSRTAGDATRDRARQVTRPR
jgi:hypothetical protein